MPENIIYSRQNLIEGIETPNTATVVGCGGTGFWTAILLAMSGVPNIVLIDNDVIELSNRNRLPIGEEAVGQRKVLVCRDWILRIRPECRVEVHESVIIPENIGIVRGSVFCCTDNIRSQQLICAYCRKNRLRYQRIGYDGTILNVSRAFPLTFKDNLDEGGYTETPSWVIPAVAAAALGIFSLMKEEICIMDDLKTVCSKNSSFVPKSLVRREVYKLIEKEANGDCGNCDKIKDCDNCRQCDDCDRIDEETHKTVKEERDRAREEKDEAIREKEELEESFEELEAQNKKLKARLDEAKEKILKLKKEE